ncbi:hypothetical protein P4O66_001073 [Electrophorus voltai]|uniref:Reverse transcriptase/retrotransposon-derived protein RNase H-like domain-containing protein n=1 Tax=Electrophorus voltai TaxID=2609070 RepID=A0AAD8ZD57_9TELE|nr:hypothetical protein P4O66_001073 [Electrophorus voltai]
MQNHLYYKLEKCEFHRREVSFLGYIICEGSVCMQPCKFGVVMGWRRPQMRRLFTDLLRGTAKKLRWNSEAEKAFEELKTAFSTTSVQQQLDLERPFMVEVDASDVGVGAVLSQCKGKAGQLKPITYFSKKLSPAERNYGIGDRELLVKKLALEEWSHWLEGARHPFKVYTDHKN